MIHKLCLYYITEVGISFVAMTYEKKREHLSTLNNEKKEKAWDNSSIRKIRNGPTELDVSNTDEPATSRLVLDTKPPRNLKYEKTEGIPNSPSLTSAPFSSSANAHSAFGVIEKAPSSNITPSGTSVLHRRSSATQKPQAFNREADQNSQIVGNSAHSQSAVDGRPSVFDSALIPPPIPESLPTTPGYELNGTSYFDLPRKNGYSLPHQQTVLAATGETVTTSTLAPDAREGSESQEEHLLRSKKELEDVSNGLTLSTPRETWRLVAAIIFAFTAGLSDGAPGALLPRIEEYYGINYTVVSMIWMSNAVGYISIALSSFKLVPWMGYRNLSACGCVSLVIMYALVCGAPPFPLVVIGFFFGGMGLATNFSFQNIFLGRFKKSSVYLGFFHGGYGLGACLGPLIATSMVNAGQKWSNYYFIMVAISSFNTLNLYFSFKGYENEQKAYEEYDPLLEKQADVRTPEKLESQTDIPLADIQGTSTVQKATKNGNKSMKSSVHNVSEKTFEHVNPEIENSGKKSGHVSDLMVSLKSPVTWYLSFFVLFYGGAEVSMGGWIVTFLEVYRHGSTKTTGYVASGFWGGLTIGRLVLTPLIYKTIGAKCGITVLIILSVFCCLLSWLVPIYLAEAVFVAFLGLFTGPMYPLMVTVAIRVLPRKIQVISMTIMTAVGSSGGAFFPFIVGLAAQMAGTYVVFPFIIGFLFGTMILWSFLPNPDRTVVTKYWQRLF